MKVSSRRLSLKSASLYEKVSSYFHSRFLENNVLSLEYTIFYSSNLFDAGEKLYNQSYKDFMCDTCCDECGAGLDILTNELAKSGIDIVSADRVFVTQIAPENPTISPSSSIPNITPSTSPPIRTQAPSSSPTEIEIKSSGRDEGTLLIVVIAVVVFVIGCVVLLWWYKKWHKSNPNIKNFQNEMMQSNHHHPYISHGVIPSNSASETSFDQKVMNIKPPSSLADSSAYSKDDGLHQPPSPIRPLNDSQVVQEENSTYMNGYTAADLSYIQEIPNEDSMLSNESLLSMTAAQKFAKHDNGEGDDLDIEDSLIHMDEFDMFRDQNLERMRSAVGEAVRGSDDMMSEALTKALMDEEEVEETLDGVWGGAKGSMEIEASALCDTIEWLKRNEHISLDMKHAYMQDVMDKMVSSVRYDMIGPEEASRAIHGCAALLGMGLAEELPENTIIVTGMPKTVNDVETLVQTFRELGEIENAAMASKSRGFGLVRYKWTKSVTAVMQKHRHDEIIIQDVAVTVRVLRSDPNEATIEV